MLMGSKWMGYRVQKNELQRIARVPTYGDGSKRKLRTRIFTAISTKSHWGQHDARSMPASEGGRSRPRWGGVGLLCSLQLFWSRGGFLKNIIIVFICSL